MKETQKFPLDFPRIYWISGSCALLMAAASLSGLLFQSAVYPSEALRRSFVSNDMVNLFIGLPILLGSMWGARRGSLMGRLFWPGALLFIVYNYLAYSVALAFSWFMVLDLILVALSLVAVVDLLPRLDAAAVQAALKGAVPERFAGGVLTVMGGLFFLRSVVQLAGGTASGPELGVLVADLLITPTWVVGGVLLWRRHAWGYLVGTGLLFLASMLFVGLLVFFVLQPFLSAVPFPLVDFVVILVMGLICFVPFGLFVKGIAGK